MPQSKATPLVCSKSHLPDGTILSLSKYRVITLYNDHGDIVGEIDFSTNKIILEGSVNDAANSLFLLLKNAIEPFFKVEIK